MKMKLNWFLLMIVCILNAPAAMATENEGGINFFEGTYGEALAKAQREDKLVFVDVYTTWCGPCKKLEKQTFTDPKVAAYMNENFVSMRLDAENQADSEFFKSYSVAAFPTMFWLKSNGEVLDKYTAFMGGEAFLDFTAKAIDSDFARQYEAMKARWEGGERTFEMFHEYIIGMVNKIDAKSTMDYAYEFVSSLSPEQIRSEQGFRVITSFRYNPEDSIIFPAFINNWEHYMDQGLITDDHWKKLYTVFVRKASIARNKGDKEAEKEAIENLEKLDFAHKAVFEDAREVEALLFDQKYKKGVDKMFELVEKYPEFKFLYSQLIYTLILSDFFHEDTKVDDKVADRVIEFAKADASYKASQRSILMVAASYARKGDFKTAYGYLANLNFYPRPVMSNAVYKRLNLPVTKKEFPW